MNEGKPKDTRLIHDWFELTYASYLVLPRSILQSTPIKWQSKFVKLLDELEDMGFKCPEEDKTYAVNTRDYKTGRFVNDIYMQYERGRRIIIPEEEK